MLPGEEKVAKIQILEFSTQFSVSKSLWPIVDILNFLNVCLYRKTSILIFDTDLAEHENGWRQFFNFRKLKNRVQSNFQSLEYLEKTGDCIKNAPGICR